MTLGIFLNKKKHKSFGNELHGSKSKEKAVVSFHVFANSTALIKEEAVADLKEMWDGVKRATVTVSKSLKSRMNLRMKIFLSNRRLGFW